MSGLQSLSQSDLEFRPYEPGDEYSILALFRQSFGRDLSLAYWRWRYLDNPVGPPMIELAWDGDVLAAHYAVSPVMLRMNGAEMLAGLSMTTMTSPDYRGRGLFPLLAERLYERMSAEGFDLVFGFPNRQSHRIFVRDLKWNDLSPVPTLKLAKGPVRPPETGAALIDEVSRFDEWVDAIEADVLPIGLHRGARFLNWRFIEEPSGRYRILRISSDGVPMGYAVFKTFCGAIDVVDVYGRPDPVCRLICHLARVHECELNMWISVNDPVFGALERIGFEATAPVTFMGGRNLRGSGDLFDPRIWSVSMAMSDVY